MTPNAPSFNHSLRLLSWLLVLFAAIPRLQGAGAGTVGELEIRDVLPLSDPERARLAEITRQSPEAASLLDAKLSALSTHLHLEPRPLAVLHYEGLLNTDARRLKTVEHLRDMDHVAALFEVWQVTSDPTYAKSIRRFILAWSSTYVPTGNDVNENKLVPLFVAYASLWESFTREDREQVDGWLGKILALHERELTAARGSDSSNRYSKRLRLCAWLDLALRDEGKFSLRLEGVRAFVSRALRADGTSHDLENRDSLTYHTSTLEPMIDLAWLSARRGVDLFSWEAEDGGSIRRSVEFVVPFAEGTRTRQEWTNSRVELDKRRADEGIPAYQRGRIYDPRDALPMLQAAEYFMPKLRPKIIGLSGSPATEFANWRAVLNEATRARR